MIIRDAKGVTAISIHALLAESDHADGQQRGQQQHFYPRSPCGERRRGERGFDGGGEFLSTLSLRRATNSTAFVKVNFPISIHALLAESDRFFSIYVGLVFPISIHALLAESD